MIRYVASFPGELSQEALSWIRDSLGEAADSRRWKDVVIMNGGTITDLRRAPRVPSVRVKNAQRRLR